jgi:hypothetical protein
MAWGMLHFWGAILSQAAINAAANGGMPTEVLAEAVSAQVERTEAHIQGLRQRRLQVRCKTIQSPSGWLHLWRMPLLPVVAVTECAGATITRQGGVYTFVGLMSQLSYHSHAATVRLL